MGQRRKMKRGCRKAHLADQVGILIAMHFPHAEPSGTNDPFTDLCCEECEDLHNGFCQGEGRKGWAVVKCMEKKAREGEVGMVVNGSDLMQ